VRRLKLACLVSGGGTTVENIARQIEAGQLDASIELVVSSSSKAYALERAKRLGIPAVVVKRGEFADDQAFSDRITEILDQHEPDLVLLAGFLKMYIIPDKYEMRVMNIHPALIPAFCGHGFYGRRVHQAVLDYGAKVSGCTVHFVNNEYDAGPVILQRTVPVLDDDTPDTLAERVFEQECIAYPEAIRLYGEGRLRVEGRRVKVVPAAAKG